MPGPLSDHDERYAEWRDEMISSAPWMDANTRNITRASSCGVCMKQIGDASFAKRFVRFEPPIPQAGGYGPIEGIHDHIHETCIREGDEIKGIYPELHHMEMDDFATVIGRVRSDEPGPEPTSDCPSEEEHYAALLFMGRCPWCGQS